MEKVIFPINQEEWKVASDFIKQTLLRWNETINTIEDVINFMRKNVAILFGVHTDIFKGFGVFLMNLSASSRQEVIKNSMKNVAKFAVKSESVLNIRLIKGVTNLSFETLYCMLACSVLCLMPAQNINYFYGSLNLYHVYADILEKNVAEEKWLLKVLELFGNSDNYCDNSVTISPLTKHNSFDIDSLLAVSSWPIIYVFSKSSDAVNLFPWTHLWTEIPETHFNSSPSRIPPSLSFIPLFYVASNSNPCFVQSSSGPSHIHCSLLGRIDPWRASEQFSSNQIIASIVSLSASINQAEMTFNTRRYTSSISYSAVPLGSKRARSGSSNSSSDLSFRRQSSTMSSRSSRQSYSSSSRSGSLQIGSLPGALILSSVSSRRSSGKDDEGLVGVLESVIEGSGVEGSHHSSGMDIQGHPGDVLPSASSSGICVQQSVIEEETIESANEDTGYNYYGDDLSQMTLAQHLGQVLQAPICDSSKLSLSQELQESYRDTKSSSTTMISRRRNSSPLITDPMNLQSSLFHHRPHPHKLSSPLICPVLIRQPMNVECSQGPSILPGNSLFVPSRCCGEDVAARMSHLSRRRQSLPCHLQSIMTGHTVDADSFHDPHSIGKKSKELSRLGDSLVSEILRWKGRHGLARAILKLRSKEPSNPNRSTRHKKRDSRTEKKSTQIPDSRCTKTPEIQLTECNSTKDATELVSLDLAKFDKELFSSSFFDDEADECFRKFSNMVTPNNNEEDDDDDGDYEDNAAPDQHKEQSPIVTEYHHKLLGDMADQVSSSIIIDSLCEYRPIGKTLYPPLVIHPFPIEYDSVLSICVKIIVAGTSRTSDNPRILILDLPESSNLDQSKQLQEVIETIRSVQGSISLSQFYSATLAYFSESPRVDFSIFLREFVAKIYSGNPSE